jgi:NitT/TauT family transport system substrate-binding protein
MDRERAWFLRRREFVHGLTMTGTAALLGGGPPPAAAEPPPETTRVRLTHRPLLCEAPNYVAEELLRSEGFTDVQYVKRTQGAAEDALGAGEVDITMPASRPSGAPPTSSWRRWSRTWA